MYFETLFFPSCFEHRYNNFHYIPVRLVQVFVHSQKCSADVWFHKPSKPEGCHQPLCPLIPAAYIRTQIIWQLFFTIYNVWWSWLTRAQDNIFRYLVLSDQQSNIYLIHNDKTEKRWKILPLENLETENIWHADAYCFKQLTLIVILIMIMNDYQSYC